MIYFDNNVIIFCDFKVVEVMLFYFYEQLGNVVSWNYVMGWLAEDVVKLVCKQVVNLIGVEVKEVIFIFGVIEFDNLAILGILE